MARKLRLRPLRGTEVECLCPECGYFHVRAMRYVPKNVKLTRMGRPVLLCGGCTREEVKRTHKDLPGQRLLW